MAPGFRHPNNGPIFNNNVYKKQRVNIKQEDIMQQILQRQDNQNPQLQALIQQQRFRQQQQQLLQSLSPAQRAHLLQQQQLRQQVQLKRPQDNNGICSRRLMKYLYHLHQHPPENSIAYWRKFVAEYYSPRAKKRWCLSLYNNVGDHSLGVFPQTNVDAWHCNICGSKSGKGFEATFEVLPRLNEIKFASGVIDELLFLDLPRECTFPSGLMMLEYGKAVEESVYEQLRVVREGHLRIIFTPDLKILSWQFCARRHEELLPRSIVAPQVNQLLQVAQKCQSTIAESGADGVSQQDLQANSNMVVTAGRQLSRTLELQSINDLGFSKRYVRCLQIAEVVGSMKDLMDFCREQKIGAIEGLKTYPQHANSSKFQLQRIHNGEQLTSIKDVPADPDILDKSNTMRRQINNTKTMVPQGRLSGSAQAAPALNNYQNISIRPNSINANNSNQNSPLTFQQQQLNNSNGENQVSSHNVSGNASKDNVVSPMSRSSSYISASNIVFSVGNPVDEHNQKAPSVPQSGPVSDEIVQDISDDFIGNVFCSSDFDDDTNFDWNM